MERMDNAEELLAIFHQTRLAPLGNTFLKVGEEKEEPSEPVVVRRRRSVQLKANTIPEYIPHQLISMHGDSDIFEDATPPDFGACFTDANSDTEKKDKAKEASANSPPTMHLVQNPAVLEPAFVGRTFSDKTDDSHEPAFVATNTGSSQLLDNAARTRRDRPETTAAVAPAIIPPAPGLEVPVTATLSATPSASTPEASPPQTQKPSEGRQSGPAPGQPITTLMIRNLPHELLQSQLAADIEASGFKGLYDFLYMPSTFGTGRGKGYAFVNFATPEVADCFSAMWHNTCRYGSPNEHVLLNVSVACIQGREANVARWDTSKMRRIRNANHRPLVTVLMPDVTAAVPPMMQQQPSAALPTLATSPNLTVPTAKPATLPKAAPPVPQAEAESPHSMVGKWCKISGLQRMTHANGLWGMVEAYDDSLERYIMRVPVDADHWFMAKILRENLDFPAQSR